MNATLKVRFIHVTLRVYVCVYSMPKRTSDTLELEMTELLCEHWHPDSGYFEKEASTFNCCIVSSSPKNCLIFFNSLNRRVV